MRWRRDSAHTLHQFLPAILEIQEAPPNPVARYCLLVIMAFVALAVAWACVGRVDVVSVAEGRIIPSARVKQIQPFQRGVVAEILVREGQRVQAGDKLVVLDRTSTAAERERIAGELLSVEEALLRHRILLEKLAQTVGDTAAIANPVQQSLLQQQYQQFIAQQATLQSQRDNRAAERNVNKETIRKLEATLPLVARRAANTKALADKKLAMDNDYLVLEEQRLSQQHDLAAAQARDVQLAAAVREAEKQLTALLAQMQAQTLQAMAEGERQQKNLQEQLAKAEDVHARQVLYAPVAGEIKDLAIHTVGGVVLEAQQLMLVVPEEQQLEVEAWLPNRDIGFVQEGAQAVVKIHTFPFSKYGTIPAKVMRIADDAAQPEAKAGSPNESAGNGAIFSMGLLLERNALNVDGRELKLVPGMQVTAEVITHQRRLIEYFFSPLKKHLQESVRER